MLLAWPVAVWLLESPPPTPAAAVLGTALVAAGVALRLVAVRRIGRGARVHWAGASGGLKTTGPYAYTRNPLYLAAACILTGLGLVAGGGVQALLLLPATLAVYTPVVVWEERLLRTRLGAEYANYLRSVPRWIGWPGPTGRGRDLRIPWREVFRREPLLVPGLWTVVGSMGLVHAGLLPLRGFWNAVAGVLGTPAIAAFGVVLLAAALGNSLKIEFKRRRHSAQSLRSGAGSSHGSAAATSSAPMPPTR